MEVRWMNGVMNFVLDSNEVDDARSYCQLFKEAGATFASQLCGNLLVRIENNVPWTAQQAYAFQGLLETYDADFRLKLSAYMTEKEFLAKRIAELRAQSIALAKGDVESN